MGYVFNRHAQLPTAAHLEYDRAFEDRTALTEGFPVVPVLVAGYRNRTGFQELMRLSKINQPTTRQVPPARFELATRALKVRCSVHLSYDGMSVTRTMLPVKWKTLHNTHNHA